MKEYDSLMVFSDYCLERRAKIHSLTAKSSFKLHGTNAHTVTTGEEGDISNLCRFAWYDWCYYREHTAAFPKQREVPGRVLGPARGEGNEMCQRILKANGKVVPRRSVRPLQTAKLHSPSELKKRQVFDELIERRHGTSINPPKPKVQQHESSEEVEFEYSATILVQPFERWKKELLGPIKRNYTLVSSKKPSGTI
jgi:hypothetical protein